MQTHTQAYTLVFGRDVGHVALLYFKGYKAQRLLHQPSENTASFHSIKPSDCQLTMTYYHNKHLCYSMLA